VITRRVGTGLAARRRTVLLALALGAALSAPASAQDIPEPVGFINDFAEVLSAVDEARTLHLIDEVRGKSGGEMVIVTMPT